MVPLEKITVTTVTVTKILAFALLRGRYIVT